MLFWAADGARCADAVARRKLGVRRSASRRKPFLLPTTYLLFGARVNVCGGRRVIGCYRWWRLAVADSWWRLAVARSWLRPPGWLRPDGGLVVVAAGVGGWRWPPGWLRREAGSWRLFARGRFGGLLGQGGGYPVGGVVAVFVGDVGAAVVAVGEQH